MRTPPPLLSSIMLAIPEQLQALPHVLDLMNTFLMPETIDAAVYNDLHRVVETYGEFRLWTVGAMDGAAARGRLDLLRWLRTNRTEGCSTEAFTGAAANGHLKTLRWLDGFYPNLSGLERDLTTAARHGQVRVVDFLKKYVHLIGDVEPAMEAAAANGYVDVVEILLPGSCSLTRPLLAAVRNGHITVVQLLCDQSAERLWWMGSYQALIVALDEGFTNIAAVVIRQCNPHTIELILESAASRGYHDIVEIILGTCTLDQYQIAPALEKAALKDDCDTMKLLLEKCPLPIDGRQYGIIAAVEACLGAAVKANRVDVAQLIVKKLGPEDYELADAAETSIQNEQEEMTKFLLRALPQEVPSFFTTGKLTPWRPAGFVQNIIDNEFYFAAGHGQVSMVRLLAERVSWRVGESLTKAAANNHVAVIKVLLELCEERDVERCEIYRSIEVALEIAVSAQNTEMVELLTKAKTRYNNRLALIKAVKAGDLEATNVFVKQNNQSAIAAALFEAPTRCSAILEVLVEHIDQETIRQALTQSGWKTQVLRLLVEKCESGAYAAVFLEAATQCRTELMELMLDKVASCTLTRALARAVSSGHSEVVKLLLDVCDASSLSFGTETAAITGQSAMAELLRGRCDAKSKRKAAAKAKAAGCDDVVQMLESKRARLK